MIGSRSLRLAWEHPPLARPSHLRKQYFYTANGFRPRPAPAALPTGRRSATNEAGEDETGHIETKPNEGIFFFDSMPNPS